MKGFSSACICENDGILIFIRTKIKFYFKILNPNSEFKKAVKILNLNSGKKNNYLLNSSKKHKNFKFKWKIFQE